MRLRAHEHDDGVARRFLDRFQERVLYDFRHRLGVPDQVHAALCGERPQLDVAPQLAHLVDADLRPLGADLEQIGMAALERTLGQARECAGEAPRMLGDAVARPAEQQVGVARMAQRDAQPLPRGAVADQVVEGVFRHSPSASRTRAAISCASPLPSTRTRRPLLAASTSS